MRREEETQAALEAALVENKRLRAEIELLKNPPAGHSAPVPESASNDSGAFLCPPSAGISEVTPPADKTAKVALFRSLFRGREDVYAERWRMKNWEAVLASKPEDRRKVDRQTRTLYPLTDEVIRLHLSGKKTVGIYPLLSDETCWLLAADFDKATWQEDALAFVATSKRLGLSAYLERSRSGNGGHVWIFFERPLPAALARKAGCAVLTQTMEARHHLGLDSYDRFFPNQDTLPKGGFGNLIALPLQWMPRQEDKSVFVDDSLCPYPDQWQLLASVRRVPADQVDWIVNDATRRGQVLGVRASVSDAYSDEEPWTLPPSRKRTETPIQGPFPKSIEIVRSNLAFVPKDGLPEAMIDRTIRLGQSIFRNKSKIASD